MRIKKIASIFFIAILLFSFLLLIKNRTTVLRLLSERIPAGVFHKNSSQKTGTVQKSAGIEKILIDRLIELETNRDEISVLHLLENSTIEISAPVPRGRPVEWIIWYLENAASRAGFPASDCYCSDDPQTCTITLTSTRKAQPTVKITLTQSRRFFSSAARMAIVVSDFTFNTNAVSTAFLSFSEPLTFSMLGSRKMASSSAEFARENNKEIILLLPMEPLAKSYRNLQEETILLHYPPDKIKDIIDHSTDRIPYFTGFSNLCGSRILDDSLIMKTVFKEAAEKNGYFLIDQPPRRAKVSTIARESGVLFRFTDVSLDSSVSAGAYVEDSLKHAALIAQKKGSAVFAASPTSQFLDAATKLLPYLQHNGIEIVPVSELMKPTKP